MLITAGQRTWLSVFEKSQQNCSCGIKGKISVDANFIREDIDIPEINVNRWLAINDK